MENQDKQSRTIVSEIMIASSQGGNQVNAQLGNSENLSNEHIERDMQSFASVVKEKNRYVFPSREQGILFPAIDRLSKNDYVISVGTLVGPKNVIYASRVSNSRMCICLSSKTLVDDFIANHKGITVGNVFIPARRLVLPAKKIILSNVSFCIPNDVLAEELKRANLKLVSGITCINAGIGDKDYAHVLSFRRYTYVALDDNDTLPSSILINYQDNYFRVFLSADEMRCFSCKNKGHLASRCPNSVGHSPSTNSTEIATDREIVNEPQEDTQDKSVRSSTDLQPFSEPTAPTSLMNPSSTGTVVVDLRCPPKKRGPPSSTGSQDVKSTAGYSEKLTFKKPKTKSKKKGVISTPNEDSMSFPEFKNVFDDSPELLISYDKFCEWVVEVKGQENIADITGKYTNDLSALLNILIKTIQQVKTTKLKARLKRLCLKLQRLANSSSEIILSDLSQEDSMMSSQEDFSDSDFY
uniref:CCHC-type domain-containing protein n=1 Tax=Photinus pyralis TaxID=7054 RepID=A0A1Y1LV00_PHOPY